MRKRLRVISLICVLSLLAPSVQVYGSEPIEEAEAVEEVAEIEGTEVVEEVAEIEEAEVVEFVDENPINSEEALYQYLEAGLYEEAGLSGAAGGAGFSEAEPYNSTNYATTNLNKYEKALYEQAKKRVALIAKGESTDLNVTLSGFTTDDVVGKDTWAAAELGVGDLSRSSNFNAAKNILNETCKMPEIDYSKVYNAVKVDCPYEFFWASTGYSGSGNYLSYYSSPNGETGETEIKAEYVPPTLTYSVARDFAIKEQILGENYIYRVDVDKIKSVNSAIKNAKAIVKAAAGYSDYKKLKYYMNELCELNSYNHEAVSDPDVYPYYGNPWQILYMFDKDPKTKVVCEGYAKSFKYLCDLSSFSNDVRCYTVSGYAGLVNAGGAHMWNNVKYNGKVYLVDVTNCDSDYGIDDALFMASPVKGSRKEGYYFRRYYTSGDYSEYKYEYYNDSTGLVYSDSDLTYSKTPFDKNAANVYKLTFKVNGGSAISEKTREVKSGKAYGKLPTATRKGYKFKGWYTAKSGGTKVTSKTICKKSRTLYAHWSKRTYTVTFKANKGSVSEKSRKVKYNSAYGKLPKPKRKGYKFKGWYTAKTGGKKVSSKSKCKKNTTLYAHWKKTK